jgi:hypothetical protein
MEEGQKTKGEMLHEEVSCDISDRNEWRERVERLIRHRLSERKKSLLYPGAPNFIEPIIDDNIRAKVAQEMSVMFGTRQLANFIPFSAEASDIQRHAEVGFDAMLRLMLDFRSKMEVSTDNKLERGFSVLKQTENRKAYATIMGKQVERRMIPDEFGNPIEVVIELPSPIIPDCEVVDPFDIVVPATTKRMRDAERICHIHEYSIRKLRELAEENKWENVDKVIKHGARKSGGTGSSDSYNGTGQAGYRAHVGLNEVEDQVDKVTIWEVYHYIDGERHRSVFCPDAPKILLECIPWVWSDDGTERPWPFVQRRAENRREEFYDTRSDAELLIDNQKAASSYMNAKGIQLDFFAKPMFSGGRGAAQKVKWVPGENLPEGLLPVPMPKVDGIFDYSADIERAKAARRSGAAQGSYGDTRMGGDKTATQVNAESLASQRLTNVSVLRDGEPMSEFYGLMWEYLKHNPVPLPMINESRQFQGQISMQVYSVPFKVESASSSQHANPDFVLQQMMSLGQFFVNNPFVRQYEFAKILTDQINPQLTNRLVFDPSQPGNGTMPIEQQVAQMAPQVENLTQYVSQLAQMDLQGEQEEPNEMEQGGMS